MSFGTLLSEPYFTGSPTSSEVPGKYPVGLNGVGYYLDEQVFSEITSRQTVPVLRTQADDSNVPGLKSLNPEDLWRRDVESWHHGAGQDKLDREESDPFRFRSSKGVYVWDRNKLSLLPATQLAKASANTNLRLAAAGARLYVTDGTTTAYTTAVQAGPPATWTSVTGTPAVSPSSIVSDGFKVYLAVGASGVYVTNTGTGAASQLVSTAVNASAVLGVVKGRLMLGTANVLYNIIDLTGPAALPTALFTHPNTGWAWTAFAEGPNALYAGGYAGDKSIIYRTGIKTDGTALDAPVVAGELPDGEIVRSLQGYLGYLIVGTDRGFRFAALDSAGNLQFGSLVTTSGAVQCLEPQDRWCWYGLSNYDASSTGLGRLDLSVFTDPLVPAYATDLMAGTSAAAVQGAVLSVVTFGALRVFTVSGVGVYAEATSKVATGSLDSGVLSYGIADDKVAVFLDVRYSAQPTATGFSAGVMVDDGEVTSLGASSAALPVTTFPVGQKRGERFEHRLTLTGDGTGTPVLTRVTLRCFPSVNRSEQFQIPILLAERHVGTSGSADTYLANVAMARQNLFALALSPQVVTYQEGAESWTGYVKDVAWKAENRGQTGWNGTCIITFLTIPA